MMKKNVKIRTAILCLAMALGGKCFYSNNRVQQAPSSNALLEKLSQQIQPLIAQKVSEEKDFLEINKLEVSDAKQLQNGNINITYSVSFDSGSEKLGRVGHTFDATAVLELISGNWTITHILPAAQFVTFHKPMIVEAQQPKSSKKSADP